MSQMADPPQTMLDRLQQFAGELKTSTLAMIAASLFLLDLVIPDPLPFVDEVVLALVTILLARWRGRRQGPPPEPKPPAKDVTPPADPEGEGAERLG